MGRAGAPLAGPCARASSGGARPDRIVPRLQGRNRVHDAGGEASRGGADPARTVADRRGGARRDGRDADPAGVPQGAVLAGRGSGEEERGLGGSGHRRGGSGRAPRRGVGARSPQGSSPGQDGSPSLGLVRDRRPPDGAGGILSVVAEDGRAVEESSQREAGNILEAESSRSAQPGGRPLDPAAAAHRRDGHGLGLGEAGPRLSALVRRGTGTEDGAGGSASGPCELGRDDPDDRARRAGSDRVRLPSAKPGRYVARSEDRARWGELAHPRPRRGRSGDGRNRASRPPEDDAPRSPERFARSVALRPLRRQPLALALGRARPDADSAPRHRAEHPAL